MSSADTIKWTQVLRRRILEQGAAMLEVSVKQLVATFSRLGLTLEKVAGAEGARDLITKHKDSQIDQGGSHISSSLYIKETLRNHGGLPYLSMGNKIYDGFRIGGRGPPVKGSLTLSLGVFFPLQIRVECCLGDPSCLDYVRDRDLLGLIQCERLLDGLGVSLGPSAFAAAGAGGGEAVPGSLRYQVALELAHAGCDSE